MYEAHAEAVSYHQFTGEKFDPGGPEVFELCGMQPTACERRPDATTPQTRCAFDRSGILSLQWFLDEITPTIGKLAD